jgi:anti-sigma-K factor RskA
MTDKTEHDNIYDLIESYVFGNLCSEEYAEIEAHLDSGCEKCLDRLKELSSLSVALADSIPRIKPPEAIKEKLMENIRRDSRESGSYRDPGYRRFNWLLAAAAVVIIALGVGVIWMNSRISGLRAHLEEARDVTGLLESPGMQFVNLEGVDPNPQAFGKVVVDPEKGNAVVYMFRLPQNPEGMEYQLWVMREGKPTSAGVFSVSSDGEAVLALKDLGELDSIPKFLVTIEPEGGMDTPTGMMYLTGPNIGGSTN